MTTEKFFDVDGERYRLQHDHNDDSRFVALSDDEDNKEILRFDNSLSVLKDGVRVGRLTTFGDDFILERNDGESVLLCPHNRWGYDELVIAECRAARALMSKSGLPT